MTGKLNPWALLGILFGVLWILNGFWEKSPFVWKEARDIQRKRFGPVGFRIYAASVGGVIIIVSVLMFLGIDPLAPLKRGKV